MNDRPASRQHRAIREGVAFYRPRPAMVMVRGADAYDLVEALCPRDLFVRTGQILHSVVLDDAGGVAGDLYVAPRDDDFLLLADGLDDDALLERCRDARVTLTDIEDAEPTALGTTHGLLSLAGPFAWELLGELLGPEIATIGYMTCMPMGELGEGALCLRTGTTGEFGYDLLVERGSLEAIESKLVTLGERFDLCEADAQVLDRCALENGFFCPRHRGVLGRSASALQLQWRVRYDHPRLGACLQASKEAHDRAGGHRLCWVIGRLDEPAPAPGPLRREDRAIGELLDGFISPTLGCFVGLAMIEPALAHPWVDGVFAAGASGDAALELRIEAPPLLQNRSLFVDPRKHVFAHRDTYGFLPITPGGGAP